jgi:isoleucyl-tRNA synthetase
VQMVSTEQVLDGYESEEVKGLRVEVKPSTHSKCERCWVQDPSVGQQKEHRTICSRCVSSLREMGIREK